MHRNDLGTRGEKRRNESGRMKHVGARSPGEHRQRYLLPKNPLPRATGGHLACTVGRAEVRKRDTFPQMHLQADTMIAKAPSCSSKLAM